MAAIRRLAAILAADVAGYSRLMGADEEGTLAALKAIRTELFDPTIAAHNGRLVKTTGDGLLVEFGSVVDALRCASGVQAGMADRNSTVTANQRIEFRIGVHQGDIVVEEGDIFGDGVNVAARLEGLASPGGICVSARVQEDAAGKLDLVFEDMGEQQLKNIARPLRVHRVRANRGVQPVIVDTPTLALPDKPSVAVLPFTNMSSDPEQEFLADGIAEDIITALSRFPSLFVIARNSSFTYKGRAVDVKAVGRGLGVRYVLEGSLRKAVGRIRVTAQLVEAETGNHVWAERYDRDPLDIFALQDEITEAVTTAIAPAIANAERQRAARKPPGRLDAWASYQRGLWHLNTFSAKGNELAQIFLQQAIDLDPIFAGSYAGLALAQIQAATVFITRGLLETQRSAEALARHAIALDQAVAEAPASLGYALLLNGDHQSAVSEARQAVAISPNLASAHGALGTVLIYSGRPREGLAALERCTRLDPFDPGFSPGTIHVAVGHYFSGEYEAAIEAAKRTIRSYPDHPSAYRWLTASLGQSGQIEEAREALEKSVAIGSASFDLHVRQRPPWYSPKDHAHMLEGLRKAGWSE